MALAETLRNILALQDLNRAIERLVEDKQRLRMDVEEQRKHVEELASKRQEAKDLRIQAQKEADVVEVSIRKAEEDNARFQIELNTVKRQDDYNTIRQRIMSNKTDVGRWEDKVLELFQRIDELHQRGRALEEQIAAAKKDLEQLEASVAQQSLDYDRQIAEVTQKRDTLRSAIDEMVLAAYERIVSKRGPTAMAKVKSRICQGCFTTITKQTENNLIRGAELVYCDSCGRILMLEESGWSSDSPGK